MTVIYNMSIDRADKPWIGDRRFTEPAFPPPAERKQTPSLARSGWPAYTTNSAQLALQRQAEGHRGRGGSLKGRVNQLHPMWRELPSLLLYLLLARLPATSQTTATGDQGGLAAESCLDGDSGGWDAHHQPFLSAGSTCNWRRIDAGQHVTMQAAHFTEPTIVSGLQEGWAAKDRWTKDGLLIHYGHHTVRVGDSLEMGRAGPEAAPRTMTLRQFVTAGMRDELGRKLYSFDRTINSASNSTGLAQRLREDIRLPPFFSPSVTSSTSNASGAISDGEWQHLTLNLGPSGEGLGFHYHDAAINAVVHGAKRWFSCPNYQNMSTTEVSAHHRPGSPDTAEPLTACLAAV